MKNNYVQIFLLHFAGGSSYSYDLLKKWLTKSFDTFSLELPGRGKRMREKLISDKEEAIKDYVKQIRQKRTQQPYIIYGHSMGATLGLSVAKHMENLGDPPSHLVVSGNPGPGVEETDSEENEKRYLMNDDDFKEALRELGGVPDEVLENLELYSFFSPIMRADFEIMEKEHLKENFKLKTPIYAVMGSEEKGKDKIQNWSRFTSKDFTSEILPGNHFFIDNQHRELAEIILNCYEGLKNINQETHSYSS